MALTDYKKWILLSSHQTKQAAGINLGSSASAPTLSKLGIKVGANKGRGEGASSGFGPVASGKAWGAFNFDKMYQSGML